MYNSKIEILENLADKNLKSIMSGKDERIKAVLLYIFITSGGMYSIDLNGEDNHYQIAIDSIYKFKKNNPNSNIDLLLDKGIKICVTEPIDTKEGLDEMFNALDYIAYKQRKKEATFNLNIEEYLRLQEMELLKIKNQSQINELMDWYQYHSNRVSSHTK